MRIRAIWPESEVEVQSPWHAQELSGLEKRDEASGVGKTEGDQARDVCRLQRQGQDFQLDPKSIGRP